MEEHPGGTSFSSQETGMKTCAGDVELHPGHGGEDTERADNPAAASIGGGKSPNN